MKRHLALAAAVLGLAVGAVGCSSSAAHSSAAPAASDSAAPNAAAADSSGTSAGSGGDQVCDSTAAKLASQAMSPEKDAMNQTLSSSGSTVKITSLTTDSSCYLVLQTDAKAGDPQAEQALKPLEQGFGESLTSSSMIKGVRIRAVDGSVLYQAAASK